MPITYTIDKIQKVVFVVGTGNLDIDTCVAHLRELVADPDFDPSYPRLADYRNAGSHTWTTEDVRQFVYETQVLGERLGKSNYAIVVSRAVHFGMARMFQMMKDEKTVGVFYTMDEARKWLGLNGTGKA